METPRNSQELRELILRKLLIEVYQDGQVDFSEKELVQQVFPHLGISVARFNEIRGEVLKQIKVNPNAGSIDLGRFVPEIAYLLIKAYTPEAADRVQKNLQYIFNLDQLFLRACVENAVRRLAEEKNKPSSALIFQDPIDSNHPTPDPQSTASLSQITPTTPAQPTQTTTRPASTYQQKIIRRRYGKAPENKNVYTAFAIWFFTGIFGGHRFYLEKPQTGFLYLLALCTGMWPLIYLFWLMDGVTLSSEVEKCNRKTAGRLEHDDYYEEVIEEKRISGNTIPSATHNNTKPLPFGKNIEKKLFEIAEKDSLHQITLKDAIKAGLSIDEAKEALAKLEQEGLCQKIELTGTVYYRLNPIL